MRFALVDDSREWSEPITGSRQSRQVHPSEIEVEVRRRKAALRLDEWRMREYVSGSPVPDRIHQICEQIDLAARALGRMSPIPADFQDDVYWPRCW